MTTSIPEAESSVTLSAASLAHEPTSSRPCAPEPTLTRVPQPDPDAPPLFELRAEYMIEPGDAPARLCGWLGRFAVRASDLLLSTVYFLGFGAFAPLVRSRDPLNLAGKGMARWLAPSAAASHDRRKQ